MYLVTSSGKAGILNELNIIIRDWTELETLRGKEK